MLSSIILLAALQQQAIHQAFHHVVSGDTLSSIAPSMGENWQQLYTENSAVIGGNPNLIYPGEVLYARGSARAVTVYSSAKTPAAQASSGGHNEVVSAAVVTAPVDVPGSGTLTAAEVGQLWLNAGGPAWAEGHAEEIAFCESGYRTNAFNPSGATGIWQILGSVVPGDLTNPAVNAENAVAKFRESGNTFAQWICQ